MRTTQKQMNENLKHAIDSGDTKGVAAWSVLGANLGAYTTGLALVRSIKNGQLFMTEALLKAGCNPNDYSNLHRKAAIHWAAELGSVEAVRMLHKYGANINAKTDGSHYYARHATPLRHAINGLHKVAVHTLLMLGANPKESTDIYLLQDTASLLGIPQDELEPVIMEQIELQRILPRVASKTGSGAKRTTL